VQKSFLFSCAPSATVEAYSSIPVKATGGGELMRIHSRGQDVKRGDLLFEIDRRPYEQALRRRSKLEAGTSPQEKQADAKPARDLAQAKNAAGQSERYAKLAHKASFRKSRTIRSVPVERA